MTCANLKHNLSWKVTGAISPCNNLVDFPIFHNVDEMFSSSAYHQLIQDHAAGIKNSMCQRCWDKESVGLVSKRQTDLSRQEIQQRIHPRYLKLDAAIGDICNAACRICGPDSSTLWQKYLPGIIPIRSDNQFWKTAQQEIDRIIQLDFGGGEPWVNDVAQQIDLLDALLESNKQEMVKLRYNTNGSIWPRHLIDRIKQFRQVEITLSIDDIQDRFEYNRWPLKWSDIDANIDNLLDLSEKNHTKITVNYTVSVFTWLRCKEFEIWANGRGLKNINFSLLQEPRVYCIKSLPPVAKFLDDKNQFNNLIATDTMTDWSEIFLDITRNLDKQRNQDFESTFPELRRLL